MRTLKVFIMSVLLLACCSWLMVSAALAEEGSGGGSFDYGVVYGPNPLNGLTDYDNPTYGVQVYASNKYDAALLALGYSPNSSSFTDDNKAYLSNASTGGAFYDFAQLFTNNNTDWGDEIVTDPGLVPGFDADVTNFEVALRLNNNTYGADNVWSAEYSTAQRLGAVASVGLVLSGSVGGGGSGTEVSGDYTLIPMQDWEPHEHVGALDFDYVAVKTDIYQSMKAYADENGQKILARVRGSETSIDVIVITAPVDDVLFEVNDSSLGRTYVCKWVNAFRTSESTRNSTEIIDLDGKKCAIANTSPRYRNYPRNTVDGFYPIKAYGWDGESTPVVPPTNWPETPQNPVPTEPDVPIHTGRGIDDLPEPNDYIEQPTYVTNVFTADLQGVIDALDEHCQHLQNAMYSNFQGFYDDMTEFIWQVVQWLGSNINDMLNDLCDYLHDLFEWLAEQFEISVSGSGYNDNTVVSWLRKIYGRLGSGTNTRPTDPVADPFDFGEWLSQLFGNFVAWLFGLGADAVGDLVEDFETLITKFPFSIPWDLGAMLALLVTAPVTPVLEFPCYTFVGGSISQVGTYRIDLSAWDDVMNTVRPMEVMVFAFWLAFKIDFFKGIIELNKN